VSQPYQAAPDHGQEIRGALAARDGNTTVVLLLSVMPTLDQKQLAMEA
jgi:hypothetical protein